MDKVQDIKTLSTVCQPQLITISFPYNILFVYLSLAILDTMCSEFVEFTTDLRAVGYLWITAEP
jgi:hypothetical protein